MGLPARYRYLTQEPIPPVMTRVALGMLGTYEFQGSANNPVILAWADEVARLTPSNYDEWAADYYNSDKIPWCGLFMGVVAARSAQARPERFPPKGYLSALAWASWGKGVPRKLENICVGDVIVFTNPTHVAQAVGVTPNGRVVCLGGNQSDSVCIKEMPFSRVYAIRRPPYIEMPAGARHVIVGSSGEVSTNER